MCAGMIDLKKTMTKIMELEEELKSTHDGYEEEIATLLEKNDDLIKKIGVFMGSSTGKRRRRFHLIKKMLRRCALPHTNWMDAQPHGGRTTLPLSPWPISLGISFNKHSALHMSQLEL